MARKIDYFGTFLDSMRHARGLSHDPARDFLEALWTGEKSESALIPDVGNLSDFLSLSEQLISQGWVKKSGDVFTLTDKGREIASILK